MKDTFLSTAEVLAEAIEKRDPYTGGHTRRVSEYSLAIAKYLSLSPSEGEDLRLAAILHDVGKIAVKDNILKKGDNSPSENSPPC
jgi:HD-GYP domain-containing protein (c-di-GMP phosphodiesterase class II)